MLEIVWKDKKSFKAVSRGHEVMIDVPAEKGGDDLGMMPTELYTVSLATCVGITMAGWLSQHGLSTKGLKISAQKKMSLTPRKIESVTLKIELAEALSDGKRNELNKLLHNCPVMLTVKHPPEISLEF